MPWSLRPDTFTQPVVYYDKPVTTHFLPEINLLNEHGYYCNEMHEHEFSVVGKSGDSNSEVKSPLVVF